MDIPDLTLPIVKMTVENEAMYGEKGIYTDYENRDAEAQGCVSLYENGELQFTMPCAFKVVGNYSRRYDKKSYQVKFRTRYGASKLKYDLFGDGEITEFKGFVLRSGSQDIPLAMMRDEFAQTVISGFTDTVLTQKYRPVSLFINDKYVGVYYIREKVNEDFVAAHYDVSPESVTIVANLMYREYGADASDWYSLWSFIKQNDLSSSSNYEYLAEHIDMNSVIDYYIALWWADNRDEGNTRIFRSTENDGKWRLLFYDADMGFGSYIQYKGKDSAQFLYGTYCAGDDGVNNALIYKLLRNATFRDLFLRRLNEWFEGALYDANVNAAIEKIRTAIDHDMHYQPYSDYNTWSNTRLPELRNYVLGRTEVMKKEIKGLLGLSDADMAKYFG